MKYLVLKNTVVNSVAVRAGDVIEVPESEVNFLIGIKRIEPVTEKIVETVDRSVGLDEADKPKKRGRPRKKAD